MGYFRNLARAAFLPAMRALTGYDAASTKRRLAPWTATRQSINSLLVGSGDELRARARDRVRQDLWAAAVVTDWAAEVVGTGIMPQSLHPDKATKQKLQSLWKRWTDEADADGKCDFYGLQTVAMRGIVEAGEIVARFRFRQPSDGLTVPLQLQLLEPEHLPFTKNEFLPNGNQVKAGIEFNRIGKIEAYHLYRSHPGDGPQLKASDLALSRVAVDEILHCYLVQRPGQIRGETWLLRILIKLWHMAQYDDAEVERKKFSAMLMGFITENTPGEALPGDGEIAETGETAPDDVAFTRLEAGTLRRLPPGCEINIHDTADVGVSYAPFNRHQLLQLARGANLPFIGYTGDTREANYSSMRAGTVKFWRLLEQIQFNLMVFQFCRPAWRVFLEEAALAGQISAADYARHRDAYLDVEWRTPKHVWVDPLKDVQAEKMAVRACFKPRSAVVKELGYDIEEVDEQIALDQERADELGIRSDADGRFSEKASAPPEDDEQSKPPAPDETDTPAPAKSNGRPAAIVIQ